MDLTLLEQLIGLVERSRVTELIYVDGGTRVRIAKRAMPSLAPPTAIPAAEAPSPDTLRQVLAPDPATPASNHILPSGMAGTFYRAAAPGEAPFVVEGDPVEDGQTLAILEAMKTLNPVECDRAGTIVRILVADGASVDVGTALFEIAEP